MVDYDSPWKEILDSFLESFMEFFFPVAYNEIDWSRGFESLDTELRQIVQDSELGKRTVDKLVKVWLKSGTEAWVLIHIEVQVQEDQDFEERMFVYHYRCKDRFGRRVVSFAVLGDDRANWRPNRYEYEKWGCSLDFRFPIVKLLDYASVARSLEESRNPFAAVVLAHLKTRETQKDPLARRSWKMTLVKSLYEQGYDRPTVRKLFRFIAWIMELPKELDAGFWQELSAFEESKKMPYLTQIEQIWLEQGMEKGRQEGQEDGLRNGLLEGIEFNLESKFGTTARSLLPEIARLSSNAALRDVRQAIARVASIDELRQEINAASVQQNGVH